MPILGPTSDHAKIRYWATANRAIPAEVLPHIVDGEPAVLRLMLADQVAVHTDIRVISWDEFFVKFDSLGLTFVYDDEPTGYNEILQLEEKSPYRRSKDRPQTLEN